jgi:hypothetical protein
MPRSIVASVRMHQQEPVREISAMKLALDKVAALKTATHALITEVGGLPAAASVCRVSVPRLSEYQSRNHPESLMPIDVVLQLEAVAGAPIVTGALARLQGHTLASPDAAPVPAIGRSVAALARHAGEVGAQYLDASADGRIDPAERAALMQQAEHAARALQDVLAALATEAGALRRVA